jgi:hypothetical protein
MAFKLSQTATYSWPMKIVLPADGGRREVFSFDAVLRRLPQSRINEIIRQVKLQERGDVDPADEIQDMDAAREVMAGWSGVLDSDGEELPFTEANLTRVLEISTVASQIVKGWFGSLNEAKVKN